MFSLDKRAEQLETKPGDPVTKSKREDFIGTWGGHSSRTPEMLL